MCFYPWSNNSCMFWMLLMSQIPFISMKHIISFDSHHTWWWLTRLNLFPLWCVLLTTVFSRQFSLAALCIENAVTVTLYGSISSCVSHLGPIYSFLRNSDDFLWAKINYVYNIITFLYKIFCGQCNTKNIDVIIKMFTPIY